MACICPVCKKSNLTVDTLVEHVAGSQDNKHQSWLESYCDRNKIDFARMLLLKLNGSKDAYKPLLAPFKKEFCKK